MSKPDDMHARNLNLDWIIILIVLKVHLTKSVWDLVGLTP